MHVLKTCQVKRTVALQVLLLFSFKSSLFFKRVFGLPNIIRVLNVTISKIFLKVKLFNANSTAFCGIQADGA